MDDSEEERRQKRGEWVAGMLRLMRSNGEALGDEYGGIFTPEKYARWKKEEPDIEAMLDDLIETFAGYEMTTVEEIREEINGRLGRR